MRLGHRLLDMAQTRLGLQDFVAYSPKHWCTPDGFVLRRTGGYNICEIALVSSHFEARPADPAANLL
jgi:hypothetical protein